MLSTKNIQYNLNFMLQQVVNEASFDGKISRDEQQILNDLRDLIKDFSNIITVMAEKLNINPEAITPSNFTSIIDESFQFILEHLYDKAKKSGDISQDESILLEKIAERLESVLNSFIKTV